MLCSENVTRVRQSQTEFGSTPRGLMKLYFSTSGQVCSPPFSHFTLHSIPYLPFTFPESTDALSKWRTASAMTVLHVMGLPTRSLVHYKRWPAAAILVFPLGRNVFGTGVGDPRQLQGDLFQGEKSWQSLSGGSGAWLGYGREFIPPTSRLCTGMNTITIHRGGGGVSWSCKVDVNVGLELSVSEGGMHTCTGSYRYAGEAGAVSSGGDWVYCTSQNKIGGRGGGMCRHMPLQGQNPGTTAERGEKWSHRCPSAPAIGCTWSWS
jgi:hypothetical protein